MGKQIRFYMLKSDTLSFLKFIFANSQNVLLRAQSQSPVPESFLIAQKQMLELVDADKLLTILIWNKKFPSPFPENIQKHERKRYDEKLYTYIATGEIFYSISISDAFVVEFSPSFVNDSRSLVKGRIWAEMYRLSNNTLVYKGREFEAWYAQISQWIKMRAKRVKGVDGYLLPAACEWYKQGGALFG